MNRTLSLVCLLAAGLSTTAVAQANLPSAPEKASATIKAPVAIPAKVAVIAFQAAVARTNEGQRNIAQLQQKYAPQQAKLKSLSDEIDSLKKQLQASGATLSDVERATRTKDIDTKEKELQRDAEDAQGNFQGDMNDMYQKLAAKVYEVVSSYAKENGYTLVVDISSQQSPVLYVDPATDITGAVIQAYNAKSGVPAPAPSASAAPHTTHPAPRK
ncbi:MAG: OmpH/Skp family outer membrane protein [Acidobacteriaceae bacterium]